MLTGSIVRPTVRSSARGGLSPRATTNMLALGIPALAVVTLGLSRTGGSLAFLGVIASIVHVLAMAVWFGAVVLLARVVLAGPGEEDLVHAVRGFGRISNPAIIATVVSGLVQVYRQVSRATSSPPVTDGCSWSRRSPSRRCSSLA